MTKDSNQPAQNPSEETNSIRRQIRKRIDSNLPTDPDLDAFCIDNFFSTFRRFSRGMERVEKINLLLAQNEPENVNQQLDNYITHQTLPSRQKLRRRIKRFWKKLRLLLFGGFVFDYLRNNNYATFGTLLYKGKLFLISIGLAVAAGATWVLFNIHGKQSAASDQRHPRDDNRIAVSPSNVSSKNAIYDLAIYDLATYDAETNTIDSNEAHQESFPHHDLAAIGIKALATQTHTESPGSKSKKPPNSTSLGVCISTRVSYVLHHPLVPYFPDGQLRSVESNIKELLQNAVQIKPMSCMGHRVGDEYGTAIEFKIEDKRCTVNLEVSMRYEVNHIEGCQFTHKAIFSVYETKNMNQVGGSTSAVRATNITEKGTCLGSISTYIAQDMLSNFIKGECEQNLKAKIISIFSDRHYLSGLTCKQ